MSAIKSTIKKLLIANEEHKYNKEVESKKMDYNKWVTMLEEAENSEYRQFRVEENNLTNDRFATDNERDNTENDRKIAESIKLCKLIRVFDKNNSADCVAQYVLTDGKNPALARKILQNSDIKIDAVIFKLFPGNFSKFAFAKIYSEFCKNENLIAIYGDEDVLLDDKSRVLPWYKPDWAPDDFLSYYYFGSVVAVKSDLLLKMEIPDGESLYQFLYKSFLIRGAFVKHSEKTLIGHISGILFHTYDIEGYRYITDYKLDVQIRERLRENTLSVIIPSKDHPDILFRCIDSFIDKTKNANLKFQFVIVDNGSSSENKKVIESFIDNYRNTFKDIEFMYIYEEMQFNFSHMCNLGAQKSTGEFLLFLNDDIEIVDENWLVKMYEKALLPYAGAVGCKLLYPTKINGVNNAIQHAGITNLRIGPAHKLQFLSDDTDHYYGKNRYCHDCIGVTGACLLMNRAIFEEVNGFDENLAVAFNDVDLCFKIFEKGYYNIVINDAKLLHHESLSRGNDSESEEKMKRLMGEKDYLYEKHQDIYGKDPFYNINLTTDMLENEYAPKYHYEVKLDEKWADVSEITSVIKSSREDRCVRVGMEAAMDIYKWKYGVSSDVGKAVAGPEDKGFYFQGYTFVIGSNNACFEKTLLLRNVENNMVYGIKIDNELRPDIRNNLPDQVNVDLTGYRAKIRYDAVPGGHYQFGMLMKDKTSRLLLHNWSNWTLDV